MSKQYGVILAVSYTHCVTPLCMIPVESQVRDAYTYQSNTESELVTRILFSDSKTTQIHGNGRVVVREAYTRQRNMELNFVTRRHIVSVKPNPENFSKVHMYITLYSIFSGETTFEKFLFAHGYLFLHRHAPTRHICLFA